MTASSSIDPLPLGTGLLLLGTGVAAITFLSLSQNDVTYARTEWSALPSMLLAAPASVLYVLHRGNESNWWRAFWTVGLLAYLLHFWWAVFGTYDGNFPSIVSRQGWVAYSNLAVTVLWTLNVIVIWLPGHWQESIKSKILNFLTWALVTVSYPAASTFLRMDTGSIIGYTFAAALVIAFIVSWHERAIIPQS
jgi:hypothetical protein